HTHTHTHTHTTHTHTTHRHTTHTHTTHTHTAHTHTAQTHNAPHSPSLFPPHVKRCVLRRVIPLIAGGLSFASYITFPLASVPVPFHICPSRKIFLPPMASFYFLF